MNAVLDEYWQAYLWTDGLQLTGLAMTLWLLILAVALGFLLAIPLAVARTCGNPLLRYPVWLYTYVFRGTPLYIQLLFFYTGVYSLNAIRAQDFLNAFFRDGFNCTVLAFVKSSPARSGTRPTAKWKRRAPTAWAASPSTGASSCPRRCAGHCRTSATK